jgi:hypothetical protein
MEATNGLGVILENRYYGESYPFDTSTTDELRFLTTEQSKYTSLFYPISLCLLPSSVPTALLSFQL